MNLYFIELSQYKHEFVYINTKVNPMDSLSRLKGQSEDIPRLTKCQDTEFYELGEFFNQKQTYQPRTVLEAYTINQAEDVPHITAVHDFYQNIPWLTSKQDTDQDILDTKNWVTNNAERINSKFTVDSDNVLYYHHLNPTDDIEYKLIMIPHPLRADILYQAHDVHNHANIQETYDWITRRYTWFGLLQSIITYISECRSCTSIYKSNIRSYTNEALHNGSPKALLEHTCMSCCPQCQDLNYNGMDPYR